MARGRIGHVFHGQVKPVLRLKSFLLASSIMMLSMLFVLSNVCVVSTSLQTNAVAQVGDGNSDTEGKVAETREAVSLVDLPANVWWWD